jgi:hypothetical protein
MHKLFRIFYFFFKRKNIKYDLPAQPLNQANNSLIKVDQ